MLPISKPAAGWGCIAAEGTATVSKTPAGHELLVTWGTFCWRRDRRQLLLGGIERPNELGKAWVIEADDTKREINGGDLITRTEAERLATAGEYNLDTEA